MCVPEAMMAAQKVQTLRRNDAKQTQEESVKVVLVAAGFKEVPRREIQSHNDFPLAGEFCAESVVGSAKADWVVSRRVIPRVAESPN